MSFEPVTMWRFRCDGDTTTGQCTEIFTFFDDDADEVVEALNDAPTIARWVSMINSRGWLAGQRLLCPRHVASAEHLVAAAMDGLPFDEVQP
jgi:hypothetical protein